jgi:ferredoxin
MKQRAWMVPNPPTPNRVADFDPERCNGCNRCVQICRSDVLMPNPRRGRPPVVLYPDECFRLGMANPPPPNLRPPAGGEAAP